MAGGGQNSRLPAYSGPELPTPGCVKHLDKFLALVRGAIPRSRQCVFWSLLAPQARISRACAAGKKIWAILPYERPTLPCHSSQRTPRNSPGLLWSRVRDPGSSGPGPWSRLFTPLVPWPDPLHPSHGEGDRRGAGPWSRLLLGGWSLGPGNRFTASPT